MKANEVDHIEVPDPQQTYAVFSKGGYLNHLISYAQGYVDTDRTVMFFDPQTMKFRTASAEGMSLLDSDVSSEIPVKLDKVDDFVALYAYTLGIDQETLETYHISQLSDLVDHVYDEDSEFYPKPGEEVGASEEETTDED